MKSFKKRSDLNEIKMIFDINFFMNNKDILKFYLNRILDYLNSLKALSDLFHNQHAFNAFIFAGKSIIYFGKDLDFNELLSKNFHKFLSSLLSHLKREQSLNFDIIGDSFHAENALDLNTKRIHAFGYTLLVNNIAAIYSQEFCTQFCIHDGLKSYLDFLKDENFINKHKNSKINDLTQTPLYLLDYITLNILNLSIITCVEHKNLWLELDAVNVMMKIANFKESNSLDAYMTILLIIDDKQVESLIELNDIVNDITLQLKQAQRDFNENNFDRKRMQIQFQSKSVDYQVHRIKGANAIYTSVIVLLDCLTKLAVNDKIKNKLFFECDVKSCLKTLLTKGI